MWMASAGQPASALRAFVGLISGRVLVEYDDDAVIVALIEDVGRMHHAVA
jgi:hypothetical protein